MEGSWRMRTPILPNYPPRRSTDYTTISDDDTLSTEDFSDVFGGAPRTILSHQFSTPGFFYENIFRQPEKAAPPVMRRGRNLPQFKIPSGKQSSNDRFQHGDIFGWEGERAVRSRSRSKASSASALSSEGLSPLRPPISGDDVSSFASKLRPINVKSRWDSSRTGQQKTTISENHDFLENLKNYSFQFSRRDEFPESRNMLPDDDLQFNSPSSAVSSLSDMETCDEIPRRDQDMKEDEDEEEEEENESMRSYVIEIDSGYRETKSAESNGVDEAIAWVKEMFGTQSSKDKSTQEHHHSEGATNSSPSVPDKRRDERSSVEETSKATSKESVSEMHLLNEKILMWSTGKEADIRLLLSSMHHILWPHSGWLAISATNLIGGSQVKKAYQKAVLCLHPDKLQQRGATLTQKYIAEKVFCALQDAWAAFTSMDVSYN